MYGLINKAVQEMVLAEYGPEILERIRQEAGVHEEFFISNQTYDDKVTYGLVTATSKVLELPLEEVLKAFGRHWVLETASKGYGSLMDAAGNSFESFLVALPSFHARVVLIYPDLKPPKFFIERLGPSQARLTYESGRPGLVPFVFGLIDGLAIKFKTKVETKQETSDVEKGRHTFLISWESNG